MTKVLTIPIFKSSIIFQDFEKSNFFQAIYFILIIHKPFPGSCEAPHKKLGRIGSAFWTFIGYKQLNRQTSHLILDLKTQDLDIY